MCPQCSPSRMRWPHDHLPPRSGARAGDPVSPLSGPVLASAALVSSPALWAALVDQTMSPETAFVRYLVCVGLVWAAFSAFAMLVGPAPHWSAEPTAASSMQEFETN